MRFALSHASLLFAVSALACSHNSNSQATPATTSTAMTASAAINTLTPAEKAAGWRLLFDGKTTAGWRSYGADTMPTGWQVVDGLLTRVSRAADIITKEQFSNFELTLDWKLERGGNSGLFYRAVEGLEWIYMGAPEFQLLDDAGHNDGKNPLTSAGALYGLYASPRGVVKPAGEWNTAKVVARGTHIEHWLNGQKVVDCEQGSADWAKRVAGSKFAAWPLYGKSMKGYIGLQEHGGRGEFRNIKIRELK
jgi:alpha-3'-ketoglucosidase